MTNKQLGVEFNILIDDEREMYLGDIMGHDIDETERYGPILERIEKAGQDWNRANIGIYGRAIVANTILLSKISHRALVNTISTQMRKQIKESFRVFMWKGEERRGAVRWEMLVKPEGEGGVGMREPLCSLDADKMRMLIALMTNDRQPWMKWIERKLRREAERWEVVEAMAAKPSRKQ